MMASNLAGDAPADTFWLRLNRFLGWPARKLHNAFRRFLPGFEENFFGSDAFSRSTARYVWFANQFGHFALGVIAAAALGHATAPLFGCPPLWPVVVSGLVFLGFYVLKEVADTQLELEDTSLPFQPNVLELSNDSLTDTAFVALGYMGAVLWAFFAPTQTFVWPWIGLPSLFAVGFGLYCFSSGRRVLPCRKRLDSSALPGFARLRRFNGKIESTVFGQLERQPGSEGGPKRQSDENSAEAARNVERFLGDPGGILVLSAKDGVSGRTFLALAVGCELVERGKQVRYVTWRTLKHRTFDTEEEGAVPLAKADALVLDNCTASLREIRDMVRARATRMPTHVVVVVDGDLASDERHEELQTECEALHHELGAILEVRVVKGLKVRAPNRRPGFREELVRRDAGRDAGHGVPESVQS
jgi:hypothetical protein